MVCPDHTPFLKRLSAPELKAAARLPLPELQRLLSGRLLSEFELKGLISEHAKLLGERPVGAGGTDADPIVVRLDEGFSDVEYYVPQSVRDRLSIVSDFPPKRQPPLVGKLQDHLAYPPRAMRAERAAAYLDMSIRTFFRLVDEQLLPPPIKIRGVVLWDRLELDAAFENLKSGESENTVHKLLSKPE